MSHQDSKAALFGKAAAAPAMPTSAGTAAGAGAGAAKTGRTMGLTAGLTAGSTGTGKKPVVGGTSSLLSNEQRAKKIEEGRELSAKGMACLKVSVFQWKADHLMAAPLFESSANAYKAAGEFDQARLMMKQCATSHEAYGAPGPAAIALLNAAKIAQSQSDRVGAATHFKEAADMWGNNGDMSQCADAFAKAAKELETEAPEEALELYNRSLNLLAPPDLTTKEQLSQASIGIRDVLRDAFKFTVRGGPKWLKDALVLAKRMVKQFEAFESEPSMCKSMASVTIIQLTMRDVVQAEQTYLQEHLGNKHYLHSNECKVIDKILMAFKNGDLEMLDDAQKGENLFYFDAEIQPLARQLSLFASGVASKSRSKEDNESLAITRELSKLAMSVASPTAAAAQMATEAPAAAETVAPEDEADLC